jgi:hypothetical protein
VSGIEHLLVLSNSRILELVLDGAEPVVGVQGFGGLGEGRRVGVLEVPKLGSGFLIAITTIVVVLGGNLREVLKGGEVCLALSACGFTFFQHESPHLRHAWLGWWWWVASSLAMSSRSHSREKYSVRTTTRELRHATMNRKNSTHA